jgi:hypothetical protein
MVIGTTAACFYSLTGLALGHYDAKAHLVVARRVFDSLTPGWTQLGAVWLPLPHVLNALPVQFDPFYRTGFSAIALSVAGFTAGVVGLARIAYQLSGRRSAAVAAAAVFALNPSVLYLQATPMTEALLYGFLALGVTFTIDAIRGRRTWPAGLTLAAVCLTRYEAWPAATALLALATVILALRRGPRTAASTVGRIAVWPALAVTAFIVHGRLATGVWFVSSGFFIAENPALGRAWASLKEVLDGSLLVAGPLTVALGIAGSMLAAVRACTSRARLMGTLPLSFLAAALLPWYAFLQGHPFRVRFMVVLVLALAAGAGLTVAAVPRRLRWVATATIVLIALWETPPLSKPATVWEAEWDRPRSMERQHVMMCLDVGFQRHDRILGSMASLAPFIQELSHAGFRVTDFVHEGTGPYWQAAFEAPRVHVDWMLLDEGEPVGDVLTQRLHAQPSFGEGFDRVCEGGGLALYRRRSPNFQQPVLHAAR